MAHRIEGMKMKGEGTLDGAEAVFEALKTALTQRREKGSGISFFSYSITNDEVSITPYSPVGQTPPEQICREEVLNRSVLPEIVVLVMDVTLDLGNGKTRNCMQANLYENVSSRCNVMVQFYEGNGKIANDEMNILFARDEGNFLYDAINNKGDNPPKKPFWKFW